MHDNIERIPEIRDFFAAQEEVDRCKRNAEEAKRIEAREAQRAERERQRDVERAELKHALIAVRERRIEAEKANAQEAPESPHDWRNASTAQVREFLRKHGVTF